MIRKMRSLLGLGLALCLMLPLLAQVAPGAGEEEGPVEYQRVTVMPFDEVTITGTLTVPSTSYYLLKPDAKFSSLVPVRMDMLPEIVRSVDSL